MKIIIFITIAIFAFTVCDNPIAKQWENQWQADFSEDIYVPIFGTDKVKGKWVYDFTNKRFFISRDNGMKDRYCGSIYKFQKTPCNQIVRDGVRYMHFPKKNFCCRCCTNKGGCGIVKPDWVVQASYVGEGTEDGIPRNLYNVKGLQNNYYDESKVGQTPLRIFQDPLSNMRFNHNTYSTKIDESVFDLPKDLNCEQSCGAISICAMLK